MISTLARTIAYVFLGGVALYLAGSLAGMAWFVFQLGWCSWAVC
jgi:hypothetical protein